VITAKEPVATLQPVTDNPYAARFTQRSELGDCTFERIEGVGFAALQDIERCVVLIAAGYTLPHFILTWDGGPQKRKFVGCNSDADAKLTLNSRFWGRKCGRMPARARR